MRDNKEPIEIFGPPGVFAFLEVSLSISQTHLLVISPSKPPSPLSFPPQSAFASRHASPLRS
jgi:hypothetical protein